MDKENMNCDLSEEIKKVEALQESAARIRESLGQMRKLLDAIARDIEKSMQQAKPHP
jgi:hypothetical protein